VGCDNELTSLAEGSYTLKVHAPDSAMTKCLVIPETKMGYR